MATENDTEVPLKEGHQISSERQVETPKRRLSETGLTEPVIDLAESLKKTGRLELSGDSSNTWEINADLAGYPNKHIKTFLSNQTLMEYILRANPILSSIKADLLLDPYLRKLLSKQGKQFPLNQYKSLVNLEQRTTIIYGPLSKIWTALEARKEDFLNENSDELILRKKIR